MRIITIRGARRSNESIELQPLQGTVKTPKGLLRRMPRVRSDEIQPEIDGNVDVKDKSPSPIGAGLPLLQRLRLLKEKQVSFFYQFYIKFDVCSVF